MAVFYFCKSFFNGLIRDRGNPQPFYWLFVSCLFQDQPGYKLSLPSGIGCNDNFPHIRPVDLGFYHPVLLSGLFDDFQPELVRHHGKIFHFPFLVFGIVIFRVS